MNAPADYIRAYMTERPVDPSKAALVIVDMQNATGSRQGALARKLQAEGSPVGDYRFDRIERLVLPHTLRLREHFHGLQRPVLHVTIGAALPDASDAPVHMRKLFVEFNNHLGSREHEIVDELKPLSGEHVLRKTTIGAFASTNIDSLLRALGAEQLWMCGVSTNMCVETTAREAADRGYLVTLVEDACGTTHEDLHQVTMRNFQRLFGRVRLSGLRLGADLEFVYRPVKAGPVNYSSHHDFVLADAANFEAGCRAQDEGFAAVCIDTMSDSGVAALRSVLDIPVFGPGRVSMLTALMLGDRFSILTMASRWKPLYKKALDELGLHHKCASVRAIEVPPDNQALLSGKEEEVFPLLEAAGRKAIEQDGAEVLILGSTTMHQAHAWLQQRLPVPIVNPGPVSYQIAQAMLGAGLTHSRVGYPRPLHPRLDMLEAMLAAGQASSRAGG